MASMAYRRVCSVFPSSAYFVASRDLQPSTARRVIEVRGRESELDDSHLSSLLEAVTEENVRLLCILSNARAFDQISDAMEHGVTDHDLPFHLVELGGIITLRTSSGIEWAYSNSDPPASASHSIATIQWEFLSPVFDTLGEHYDFCEHVVLPIVGEVGQRRVSDSGWVATMEFEPSHMTIPQAHPHSENDSVSAEDSLPKPVRVTMKYFTHRSDFNMERKLLAAANRTRSEHIVTLLASLKFQKHFCVLLPLAHGNLRDYWAQSTASVHGDATTAKWALQQMQGLADAIDTIHENLEVDGVQFYGLHGDINASNILVFGSPSDGLGTLKLADFACGAICHDRVSAQHMPKATFVGTYLPPEGFLEKERSQKFDMWGLGCVFLEFGIWLLEGRAGLQDFGDSRRQTDFGFGIEFENDFFFKLSSASTMDIADPERAVEVNTSVHQKIQDLKQKASGGPLATLFEIIESYLLRIDPSQRASSAELVGALRDVVQH